MALNFLGRKDAMWFENGATGSKHGKFIGHALYNGREVPILGTTVSKEGLAFVSPAQLSADELAITFTLRQRRIPSRVKVHRGEAMQAPERIVHRYFCSFIAIAADDWDAVVRYVEDRPEPPVAVPALGPLVDEDFRTLPSAVQHEIVEQLVRMKRLAPPKAGHQPLIRLQAGAVRELGDGRSCQDVIIHSRLGGHHHAHEPRSFDTRFRVYANHRIEIVA